MRPTTQIGDNEIDQVILDLGSDAIVCLKNVGENGETYIAVVPDSIEDGEPEEDNPYGTITWSHCRYRRCEHAG